MVWTYVEQYQFVFYLLCMLVFAFEAGQYNQLAWLHNTLLACALASLLFALLAQQAGQHWHISLGVSAAIATCWLLALIIIYLLSLAQKYLIRMFAAD